MSRATADYEIVNEDGKTHKVFNAPWDLTVIRSLLDAKDVLIAEDMEDEETHWAIWSTDSEACLPMIRVEKKFCSNFVMTSYSHEMSGEWFSLIASEKIKISLK